MKKCYNGIRGFTTLLGVLIVGAVASTIALSLLVFGIDSAKTSFVIEQSSQAQSLANACAQEALEQIRVLNTFTGSGTLNVTPNSCTYTVTDEGGSVKKINATGIAGTITLKIQVFVNRTNTSMDITSWQEVADF